MSTSRTQINQSSPGKHFGPACCRWAAVLVLLLLPARAFAVDASVLAKSLLLPGTGQAQQGHYTRGAIYAGSAIISGFGLIVTQVFYNEAVTKYNDQKRVYMGYESDLAAGRVISIADIESTYQQMEADYQSAEDRLVWRNVFLGAFIATYAINVIDVLISKPYDTEQAPRLSVEPVRGGARIVKTFRF